MQWILLGPAWCRIATIGLGRPLMPAMTNALNQLSEAFVSEDTAPCAVPEQGQLQDIVRDPSVPVSHTRMCANTWLCTVQVAGTITTLRAGCSTGSGLRAPSRRTAVSRPATLPRQTISAAPYQSGQVRARRSSTGRVDRCAPWMPSKEPLLRPFSAEPDGGVG